jgi:hypothetical protein
MREPDSQGSYRRPRSVTEEMIRPVARDHPVGGLMSSRFAPTVTVRLTPARLEAFVALIGSENRTTAAPRPASRRRSRAKPRPPRPRAVILAELRGLGGLVLEQALLDATAEPLPSLLEWSNRLATELSVDGVGTPENYRGLLRAIVEVNKRAERAAAAAAEAA